MPTRYAFILSAHGALKHLSSELGRYRLRLRSRPPPRSRDECLGLIGRHVALATSRSRIQGSPDFNGRPFVLGFGQISQWLCESEPSS